MLKGIAIALYCTVVPNMAISNAFLPEERVLMGLFDRTKDSVVSISTLSKRYDPWRGSSLVPQGVGSGFLYDDKGHIVTNAHVIAGASGAEVHLADGRTFSATFVGSAPMHDLAVLKVDIDDDLPAPLELSLNQPARVGQTVLAIGNPFGLDWTLTTGIVSATGREISSQASGKIEGLIQTDAAINPGNSGGALIDSSGKLLGVNTAIYSPSGSNAGIGFAIPADTVARVVPQLIEKGHYSPPYLGIVSDPRFDRLLSSRGLNGVGILGVDEGSPAAIAGLRHAERTRNGVIRLGDVITAADGKRVSTRADLDRALDARVPGSELQLEVRRGETTMIVDVTLANPR